MSAQDGLVPPPAPPHLRAALARARRPLAAFVVADLLGAALVAVGPFATVHAAWSAHPDGDAPLFEGGSPALAELVETALARPVETFTAPVVAAVAVTAALHLPLLAVIAAARGDAGLGSPPGGPPTARAAAAVALPRWPASLGLGLGARVFDALVVSGAVRVTQATVATQGDAGAGLTLRLAAIALVGVAGLGLVRLVEDTSRAALAPERGLLSALALGALGARRTGPRLLALLFGSRVVSWTLGAAALLVPLGDLHGAALVVAVGLVGSAIAGRALARAAGLTTAALTLERLVPHAARSADAPDDA